MNDHLVLSGGIMIGKWHSRSVGTHRSRCHCAATLLAAAAVVPATNAAAQVTPHTTPAPDPAPGSTPIATLLKPVPIGSGLMLKPIADLRIRYETVDQVGLDDAHAVTARLRSGIELASESGFSALVEAEGLLPIVTDYNSDTNSKTRYAIVADPANVELNRAQVQYKGLEGWIFTAGRQLINIDDQRFVGASAWRQNEQTFDAVRVEAKEIGPFFADVAYSWSDRTIYGVTAQRLPATSSFKQAIDGDNIFVGAGVKLGPVTAKGFAYLIDQDELGRRQFSSQTYGGRTAASIPVGPIKVNLVGSYARQSDYASNPNRYRADYRVAEGGATFQEFGGTIGYEVLGADDGRASTSFQTPLATLHKFNGFADIFLTTPTNGLTDLYVQAGRDFAGVAALPGLTASVAWHRFRSDRLDMHYGDEWDAQLGVKRHGVGVLAKYAAYDADRYASDTHKFWLELDVTI